MLAADDFIQSVDNADKFLGEALAILFPILFVESVRIWLIFAQDFFGSSVSESSSVSGNPARCG
jgi:hypothetical protein